MAEIVPSNAQVSNHARKVITFDGSAGNGGIGAVNLFTITGQVEILAFIAYCSDGLVSAGGGTLIAGDATTGNALILLTTATALTTGLWWVDATPAANKRGLPAGLKDQLITAVGTPLKLTVATGAITAGTLTFDVFWLPISPDGALVPV